MVLSVSIPLNSFHWIAKMALLTHFYWFNTTKKNTIKVGPLLKFTCLLSKLADQYHHHTQQNCVKQESSITSSVLFLILYKLPTTLIVLMEDYHYAETFTRHLFNTQLFISLPGFWYWTTAVNALNLAYCNKQHTYIHTPLPPGLVRSFTGC